jgi:perosamine synthetase
MGIKSIQVFKPLIVQEAIDAVSKTLLSGWIGLGPRVEEFEMMFAKYLGVDPQCVIALNSCTAALHLAILNSGISDGDEVITTANTFVSTNHVILYEGGIPVFCDIDPGTGCIDSSLVEKLITPKTKIIMAVHFAGFPCDIWELQRIANKYGLFLIEDCAHAVGSRYRIGSVGDFGCFSFHAVKNLPIGDGGMLVVKDKSISGKIRSERWLGIDKDTRTRERLGVCGYEWQYSVPYLGFKYHMNDISAAIGIEQLKYLDRHNSRRREIASMYYEGLKDVDSVKMPSYLPKNSTCHFYPILFEEREKLISHLKSYDIHPGVHYLRNDSYQVYEKFKTELPQTNWFTSRELTLPIHLYLSDEDVDFIISVICKGWR